MQEPTLAKPQKAEHDRVSKHNTKSAIEQHRNIYSSPMEGVKVQLQLLHTGEVYKRRLAKLEQKKTSTRAARYIIPTDHLGKDQNSKQDSSKSYMLNFV